MTDAPEKTPEQSRRRPSWIEAQRRRERHRGSWIRRILPFLPLALLLQFGVSALVDRALPHLLKTPTKSEPVELVFIEPPPEPEEEEEIEELEELPEDLKGQLVELPPEEDQPEPEEADYLAETNKVVEEETRVEEFQINPEVVAPVFSEEQQQEEEQEVEEVPTEEPAEGAEVGNDKFDPTRDGNLRALPSPFNQTNQQGLTAPAAASSAATAAGAPQNDLINEKLGDQLALNAKEYLYANYLLRIRRLVNFYWKQNIDNLPASIRLAKSSYTTQISAILDSRGQLEIIQVTVESGSVELDDAVTNAFKMASPFPNPPEGLIEKDGRVYLPPMAFTVRQGAPNMDFGGVDPNAGMQFPGILKSPR